MIVGNQYSLEGWTSVNVSQSTGFSMRSEIVDWLKENVKDKYWCQYDESWLTQYWFRKKEDAVMFALRWS